MRKTGLSAQKTEIIFALFFAEKNEGKGNFYCKKNISQHIKQCSIIITLLFLNSLKVLILLYFQRIENLVKNILKKTQKKLLLFFLLKV